MGSPGKLVIIFLLLFLTITTAKKPFKFDYESFNKTYPAPDTLQFTEDTAVSQGALQITPDTSNSLETYRQNKSGRVVFQTPFKLWEGNVNSTAGKIASFNTSFGVNIYRVNNTSPGEGFAFIIAPDLNIPAQSYGQYLGLTNASTDGNWTNHLIAIELDTVRQEFDPDDNHMGLNINSIKSNKVVSLASQGIIIAPPKALNYTVWIQYNGTQKVIKVYMALQGKPMPKVPVLNESLNIGWYLNQYSYFGFSASTGNLIQLNCVLRWDLTVEILPEDNDRTWLKIGLVTGTSGLALLLVAAVGFYYFLHKGRPVNDPRIMGALRSLPGTPREFSFKDLRRATNNFDEKLKLGQGGFGIVYKGVLAKENNMEIAVKKFSRENIQGKDDFLAELTIINRLRHKHLVRLVGWCHKNGMLLLVYDYMPNGSLDNHLFGKQDKILSWDRRYKIISGVASAINYLHNEYDQKVVHRDLKASNIMLDSNYNARLGDFGLARALENEKTSYADIGGIPGTLGYIAPECFHTGKATRESDVYGFGAVVLEVVCGERPWTKIAGFQCVVDWVWMLHRENRIFEAVDERLGGDFNTEEAERLILLGLACSHPISGERPKPQTIVQIISGSVPPPYIPPFKPAFVWPVMEPTGDSSMTNTHDTTPMSSSYYGVSQESNTGYSDLYTV
ncbi:hypothetical protein GIB67_025457 [Kingdonia uniflora]|uniref:Protein kinase domain-containing protein n=1 Tax=Kingdonia uniflora TaxID=39325 RepID=A0A7J7N1N5_9MAGN|nr:hypothetical protein GIB67_025457 [Kingdonia uniflora]